jgi:hypothetical protein
MVRVFVGVVALKPVRDANAIVRRLHRLFESQGYVTGDFKLTEYETNVLAGFLYVEERFRSDTAENGWLANDGVIKAEVERVIADGDDSKYVRETLRDLEAQARIDTAAIDEAKRTLKSPVRLPTPEALVERARDLEKVLVADPVRAREALRGLFEDGRIEMHPSEDGGYVAKATLLPLAAVISGELGERTGDSPVAMPFHVTIPKPPDRRKKSP